MALKWEVGGSIVFVHGQRAGISRNLVTIRTRNERLRDSTPSSLSGDEPTSVELTVFSVINRVFQWFNCNYKIQS